MTERTATHIGIAWKWRHWHNSGDVLVHAVSNDSGALPERLPDGRIGWDRPWTRLCDGGAADERRFGWTSDVTCSKCRAKLFVEIDPDEYRIQPWEMTLGTDETEK